MTQPPEGVTCQAVGTVFRVTMYASAKGVICRTGREVVGRKVGEWVGKPGLCLPLFGRPVNASMYLLRVRGRD